MKSPLKLTGISLVALALAGGLSQNLLAVADQQATATAEASASSGTNAPAESTISEQGMAAISDIQLARLAINDGYTDHAVDLLKDAGALLQQVEDRNGPVTVTTEIKVGDKPPEKNTVTKIPDLIPILSEIRFVEALEAAPTEGEPRSGSASARAGDTDKGAKGSSAKTEANAGMDSRATAATRMERMAAAETARQQWRSGARQAAMETLKPVELGLVTRVVSMPIKDTRDHLAEAVKLLDDRKFHEANLALKAIEDGLVVATNVVMEPAGRVPEPGIGKAEDKAD